MCAKGLCVVERQVVFYGSERDPKIEEFLGRSVDANPRVVGSPIEKKEHRLTEEPPGQQKGPVQVRSPEAYTSFAASEREKMVVKMFCV